MTTEKTKQSTSEEQSGIAADVLHNIVHSEQDCLSDTGDAEFTDDGDRDTPSGLPEETADGTVTGSKACDEKSVSGSPQEECAGTASPEAADGTGINAHTPACDTSSVSEPVSDDIQENGNAMEAMPDSLSENTDEGNIESDQDERDIEKEIIEQFVEEYDTEEAEEFDAEEHDTENNTDESTGPDFADKSKSELIDIFSELLQTKPVQMLRRDVDAIKIAFYKIHRAEEEQKRKEFIDGGGAPEDFSAPSDPMEQRIKELFSEYRRRRDEFISGLERVKEDNLKVKLAIIEELKELVNSSETLDNTFSVFRELQQRWKDAGPVPQANVKDLWETYNLHVENFYGFIKINKELRDLDLKKNYEAKTALCEEAESLILEPSMVNAFRKLQKLHEQWRETGPVAKEHKEVVWERFREASSRINKQHQEYFDRLKDEQKANLDLKRELCVKTEELSASMLTTRKDWNRASDELMEIQKVWKTIGFAPKKDNAKIYERFRKACDIFFEQKRNFYSQFKTEMEHNLHLKNEICEAAEAIRDSEDWKKTTDELIALQTKWKSVGPVPRRQSDAIWKRFRAACNHFFDRKEAFFSSKDSEYEQNLAGKRELLDEIKRCDMDGDGFETINNFQRRWSEIGFVPIKYKNALQKEYKAEIDRLFIALRGNEHSRGNMDRFKAKVQNMKSGGDKRLRLERDKLYNKVKQLESDISLLENNIGFFSKSKNAEIMIKEVREKIERAREEMNSAIEKINVIDNEQ